MQKGWGEGVDGHTLVYWPGCRTHRGTLFIRTPQPPGYRKLLLTERPPHAQGPFHFADCLCGDGLLGQQCGVRSMVWPGAFPCAIATWLTHPQENSSSPVRPSHFHQGPLLQPASRAPQGASLASTASRPPSLPASQPPGAPRSRPRRELRFSEGLSADGDFTSSPTAPCPAPAV